MRRAALALAAIFAVLVGAPAAPAAQRYAAPGGSGTACNEATPCTLSEAVTKASKGDEVILAAGTYAVGSTLVVAPGQQDVHIRGDYDGPPPRIVGSVAGFVFSFPAPGGRLSHLDISNESAAPYGAVCPFDGSVDRIRVATFGNDGYGLIQNGNCVIRDSVILADGTGSTALSSAWDSGGVTGVVRNVTAIARGTGSTGVRSSYTSIMVPGSYTLNLKNVIADGAASDLTASAGIGVGNIVVANSNFDVSTPLGLATITGEANQTSPPQFVDAAAGDYRPAAGSPTIDAGSTDGIGPLDLAGNPRTLGAAPDIGAFEFVPPPAPPSPVAAIESLALAPRKFRTVKVGGAILSAKKRKRRAPVGTTVRYALNVAAAVEFRVERGVNGRLVGKKCRKPAKANRKRKRCTRWLKGKGSFTHPGAAGRNGFKFSGRLNGKALSPGRYRLVGEVGSSVKRAGFRIVR